MLALREWAPSPPLALSAQELYDLRFCGAGIVIQPSGSGTYQLTPGSIVGSISTPTLRVVIRPKFPIERVFYVIATARRIELSRSLTVLGEQPDLTEGFVGLYINMLAPRLRRGLLKGYRQEKDSLQTIRGRLRTADQARRRYGLPLPVEVSFDEFTEDIPENRLIKASLRNGSTQLWRRWSSLPIIGTPGSRCRCLAARGSTSTTGTSSSWQR